MARATDILDLGAYTWEWWIKLEAKGHGILAVIRDPGDEWEQGIVKMELSAAEIHAAFNAIASEKLCCEDAMREDGYGFGCANDADIVLQWAVFGEIIYG